MHISSENRFSVPVLTFDTVPTLVNKTGQWRFLTPVRQEKISPCRAACPLNIGIPYWVNKLKEEDWEGAWGIMRQYNPFPAVTGHVCYRYCQEECNRGFLDEEVSVAQLEKALGAWRHENYKNLMEKENRRPQTDAKVAVVGSGPSGLASAYYLNALGAQVTVFEKLPEAGGLLTAGIPEYRLPREVLHKELEILQQEGIVIKTNIEVGRDISLEELENDFDAVLLSVGAQQSKKLDIKGSQLPGVMGALDFLYEVNLQGNKKVPGSVVVIGGGNTALDAASLAKFNGAGEVTVLYRRSLKEMPAHEEEVKTAEDLGVKFLFETKVEEILGQEKAEKVKVLETCSTEDGESVEVVPGSAFYLECDLLIAATGEESSLPGLYPLFSSFLHSNREEHEGNHNSVFLLLEEVLSEKHSFQLAAAGDAVSGPANVATAILGGKKAAVELSKLLWPKGRKIEGDLIAPSLEEEIKQDTVSFEELNSSLVEQVGRRESTRKEAERCFGCGICNKCGVCWAFCPDLAVDGESGEYEILLDYCKGCGICVAECPAGALTMVVSSNGTQNNER